MVMSLIQLLYIFIFLDDEYKQIIKDIGNGLSLVSVQDLNVNRKTESESNNCFSLVSNNEIPEVKHSFEEKEETISSPSSFEPNEQERIIFDKLWNNRVRIQMQHQQLMTKAARLLSLSSFNNDLIDKKNIQLNNTSDIQTMPLARY